VGATGEARGGIGDETEGYVIKFEKLEPGMVLLDIHRERMGNTRQSQWGLWEARIISVDPETRTAMVRWNGNALEKWPAYRLQRLRTKPSAAYVRQQERRGVTSW